MNLNMGSGNIRIDGFINVDINPRFADIVHDLRILPYPFEDNSVDKIVAAHVVEHLYVDENILFMNECWRILKPGGVIEVIFPMWNSESAWVDPTHVRAIHPDQYKYFTPEEYMTMQGNLIIFEDGAEIFFDEWTKDKDYLLDGWSKFIE